MKESKQALGPHPEIVDGLSEGTRGSTLWGVEGLCDLYRDAAQGGSARVFATLEALDEDRLRVVGAAIVAELDPHKLALILTSAVGDLAGTGWRAELERR